MRNNPYQLHSVFWDEDANLVRFKYPLPIGTNQEDVTIEVDEDGNLLTMKSKVVSSHNDPLSSAFNSMVISGSSLLSFLRKNEGDPATPIISMKFKLPAGLNLNGFKTAMDDAGVLTVTFTKLKPEKKKLVSVAKKMLGCLAHAVPAACFLICEKICDAICSGD
ncbi:hypothetical protein WN944_027324 [Citrus x changshan-huyou]|uniref:SHSP domain-containing protein n=2 Tax=Citrus TaxID=2706 RepID=A0AAP0LIG3_9ROSI